MRTRHLASVLAFLAFTCAGPGLQTGLQAQDIAPPGSKVVIFWDPRFPAADAAPPDRSGLAAALPDAHFTNASELPGSLSAGATSVLVLPYGSAFPEDAWPALLAFLKRGGNLVVLGGQAFARPAHREGDEWRLRRATQAFSRELLIDYYEETSGSTGLQFEQNEDVATGPLPRVDWKRAFSPIVRLSNDAVYPRQGSTGALDAGLYALGWGSKNGKRLAAPILQLDHWHGAYAGGRWMLLACETFPELFSTASGRELIRLLVTRAQQGAERFEVHPSSALYLDGEPIRLRLRWDRFQSMPNDARVEIEVEADSGNGEKERYELAIASGTSFAGIDLAPRRRAGLQKVSARLWLGRELRAISRTGFWMRDEALLRSGRRITVNRDYFEADGRPLPVVGTTYMASDVQRQFFIAPNPHVWDRDFAEIRAAGLNMLRTGWWTAWDQVATPSGAVNDGALRTLEAYLLTARKHDLPVQFTFFAFIPDQFGGENPYLDADAVRRQHGFVLGVVSRFKDVPFLSWDLINEPSFSDPAKLWVTRPKRDPVESAAWERWLVQHHGSLANAREAWNVAGGTAAAPSLPSDDDFALPNVYRTADSLKVHDYHLFAQEKFAAWALALRNAIRGAGSRQLVTVGQDEGGGRDRPAPAFFSPATDFTTTHMWWLTDALLWDALVAKQPGAPMLAQEVGVNHDKQVDGFPWRTPQEKAALLERKVAVGLGTGAGAIEWLYNVNGYMKEEVEISIGAKRVDGTEKPELEAMRQLARFAGENAERFRDPQLPSVAIVTSQSYQYSAFNPFAVEAQITAVRAAHQYAHIPTYMIAENRLAELGRPKLVLLPSPQSLGDDAWQALMRYVEQGGNLLITGSVERDPYWRPTSRMRQLGLSATTSPIALRGATVQIGPSIIPVRYSQERQYHLERIDFGDDSSFKVVRHGRGTVYLVSEPVELAEGPEPVAAVYNAVFRMAGIAGPYIVRHLSSAVLVRPTVLRSSVLYLVMSESRNNETVEITDRLTGVPITLRLAPGRAALILLDKRTKKSVAHCCDWK